jgi:hypothetical protein
MIESIFWAINSCQICFTPLWARINFNSNPKHLMNSCIIFKENYVPSKTVDRSILHGEYIDLFRAAIKSPSTRDPYERPLINFLKMINLTPDAFIRLAKKDSSCTERKTISFISIQTSMARKGEISSGAVS